MKAEVKKFPRSFRSSSAAYRAVRQYEENHLNGAPSGLVMTKLGDKNFLMSLPAKMSITEFNEKLPKVSYPRTSYRYFADGVKGEGYYELKTGDRRRPNSLFMTTDEVYTDFISDKCK
jgi:hypothetical protein